MNGIKSGMAMWRNRVLFLESDEVIQATVNELVEITGIHEKNVRLYLNQFIDNWNILVRLSEKQRDKNAKYAFKKL